MSDKPNILIIDDNQVDLKLETLILEKNEFNVIVLESAMNCLEVIATSNINLVLLDIMMPEMDGNQALEMIRKKYNQLELPVIMVTSKSDASDILEALKIGANDYITKPIHFEIALRRIQTHLLLTEQSKVLADTKELDAVRSSIAIIQHEINNPLTKCFGKISLLKKQYPGDQEIEKLEGMIWGISDTLKKTEQILNKHAIKFSNYIEDSYLKK